MILKIILKGFVILFILFALLGGYVVLKEEHVEIQGKAVVEKIWKWISGTAGGPGINTFTEELSQLWEQAQQVDHPTVAIAFLREGLEKIEKLKIMEQDKYLSFRANFSFKIGEKYNVLGHADQAQDYLQKALAIYQKLEHIKGQGETLTELGILFQRLAQFERALKFFQEALAYPARLKQEDEQARILTHLGTVYGYRGQDQHALEKFEQALDIYRRLQKTDGIIEVLSQKGVLHRNRQRYPEALKIFEEALGIAKTPQEQANLLMQEGITYLEKNQFDKAIAVLERAEFFFGSSQSKDLVKKIEAMIKRGEVNFAQGLHDAALKLFTKSLELSQEVKSRQGEWESLIRLGLTYDKVKRYDEALTKFMGALEVDAQDGFLLAQERLKRYDDIIQLLETQPAYAGQALKVFESRQRRLFLNFVGKPLVHVKPLFLQEEEKLTHRLEKINDHLAQAYAQQPVNSDRIQKSTSQLKQWQSEQIEFEKKLAREVPDYYFFKYAEPSNLKTLQSQLLSNEAMLIYHVMHNETWLWAIHREQFIKEKLSLHEQTLREESLSAFLRRLSSRKLNQWLAKIKPQKLYLVPTQALCYTPFSRYLSYPLIYLPSASSLRYLRNRTPPSHKSCQKILTDQGLSVPEQIVVSDVSSTDCLIEMTSKPSQFEPPVCSLVATLLYAGVSTVSVKPWLPVPPSPKKVQVAPPITFGIQ